MIIVFNYKGKEKDRTCEGCPPVVGDKVILTVDRDSGRCEEFVVKDRKVKIGYTGERSYYPKAAKWIIELDDAPEKENIC